jgi:anthranilate/para-aminobenzoate synthase component I
MEKNPVSVGDIPKEKAMKITSHIIPYPHGATVSF